MTRKMLVVCILLIKYPVFSDENRQIVITLPGDTGIEDKVIQGNIKNTAEEYVKVYGNDLIICSDGIIEKITKSDGITIIEIKFNTGDRIIFSNLLECDMQKGDVIRKGQVVGKIDDAIESEPAFCLISSDHFNNVLAYSMNAIKIRCPVETPVFSISNGIIFDLDFDGQCDGLYLEFCNDDICLRYTNLSRFNALKNQLIDASQIIAYTGMMGNTDIPVLTIKLMDYKISKKKYFVFVIKS